MAEAQAYLAHPLLGARRRETTAALQGEAGTRSAAGILGLVDALTSASCRTLFDAAGGGGGFTAALDTFYGGARDQRTLARLSS